MEKIIPFDYKMSAHCETGTLSSQLAFHGLELSESIGFWYRQRNILWIFQQFKICLPHLYCEKQTRSDKKEPNKTIGYKISYRNI